MAEKEAILELYAIMADSGASERDRLNSAVSASRIEPLVLSGEEVPPGVKWLRKMMDDYSAPTSYRREAASAVAYWERRSKKAQLQYNVVDLDERRQAWRRLLNGALRRHLWQHNRWPADRAVLYGEHEAIMMPAHDPELALRALLMPGNRQQRRRRKAIDEPETAFIGSEAERVEILRSIAKAMHQRLAEFETSRSPTAA